MNVLEKVLSNESNNQQHGSTQTLRVFYNAGAQIFGKVIAASITLLITLIITRTLGASGYGDFTKIFVFVGYFYTLADFGLNSIFVKIAIENEITHLRTLWGLRIVIGIALASTAVIIAYFLPYDPKLGTGFSPLVKAGITIAALTIVTQAMIITENAFFQKALRYDIATIAALVGYLTTLVAAAIVSFSTKSVLGYAVAYVIGALSLITTAYLIIAKRVKQFFTPKFNKEEFKELLKPAWPVGLALLFNLIYFRIDVFILSNFRSSTEVGIYGLSYQFFETSLAIPIFFANSIYPALSNIFTQNRENFADQVKSWLKILTSISALMVVGLIVASLLIPMIFGREFLGSTKSLQILAGGVPFFFISALLWQLLIIYDKQKFLTVIYAAGAIFNIIANLIFIPTHGYIAASIITVISEALITLMLVLALKTKNLKFDIGN